ncbi:MAG: hypothetical protein IT292_09975 [Deltaproteobacteria bacterium]|nr:hypothetical protein [Deltaproteobacteria bacterium]
MVAEQGANFQSSCLKFYRDKTYQRVKRFFTRYERIDAEEIINGVHVPMISTILDSLDWEYIAKGSPVRFHGDLHFENILVNGGTA